MQRPSFSRVCVCVCVCERERERERERDRDDKTVESLEHYTGGPFHV